MASEIHHPICYCCQVGECPPLIAHGLKSKNQQNKNNNTQKIWEEF
jgi:hypothetical protein